MYSPFTGKEFCPVHARHHLGFRGSSTKPSPAGLHRITPSGCGPALKLRLKTQHHPREIGSGIAAFETGHGFHQGRIHGMNFQLSRLLGDGLAAVVVAGKQERGSTQASGTEQSSSFMTVWAS
jgi:hypothetical protein